MLSEQTNPVALPSGGAFAETFDLNGKEVDIKVTNQSSENLVINLHALEASLHFYCVQGTEFLVHIPKGQTFANEEERAVFTAINEVVINSNFFAQCLGQSLLKKDSTLADRVFAQSAVFAEASAIARLEYPLYQALALGNRLIPVDKGIYYEVIPSLLHRAWLYSLPITIEDQ